jgi:hypothetical protein
MGELAEWNFGVHSSSSIGEIYLFSLVCWAVISLYFRCRSKVCDAVRYIARPKTQVTGEIYPDALYKGQMISSPLCSVCAVCVCVSFIYFPFSFNRDLSSVWPWILHRFLFLSLCVFHRKWSDRVIAPTFLPDLHQLRRAQCFVFLRCYMYSCSFYIPLCCLCFSSNAGLSSFFVHPTTPIKSFIK